MKPFTPAQAIVVQAPATGATITAAAELASVSRTTIYTWLENPVFKHAIAYSQQEYAMTMQDRMQALSAKALDKLEALLDDPRSSPSVILKASLAILNRPQFPKQGWVLPAASLDDCVQAIDDASAQMEADPEIMKYEAEYHRQLTNLYTKSNSATSPADAGDATPRSAPCPCGSGLKFKRCCGQNAPPVLHRDAA